MFEQTEAQRDEVTCPGSHSFLTTMLFGSVESHALSLVLWPACTLDLAGFSPLGSGMAQPRSRLWSQLCYNQLCDAGKILSFPLGLGFPSSCPSCP